MNIFRMGPCDEICSYVEDVSENNTVTPTVVIYEVYKRLKKEKSEQIALEAYATSPSPDYSAAPTMIFSCPVDILWLLGNRV